MWYISSESFPALHFSKETYTRCFKQKVTRKKKKERKEYISFLIFAQIYE